MGRRNKRRFGEPTSSSHLPVAVRPIPKPVASSLRRPLRTRRQRKMAAAGEEENARRDAEEEKAEVCKETQPTHCAL
eukprot:4663128-Karenia_brevis.AAC.1